MKKKTKKKQNKQCQAMGGNFHIHGLCTCSGYGLGPKGFKDK